MKQCINVVMSVLSKSVKEKYYLEKYFNCKYYTVDRRSYPEDRGPSAAPPLPPPAQPAPRVEKKPEIKNIDDILKPPGRLTRPERVLIVATMFLAKTISHCNYINLSSN